VGSSLTKEITVILIVKIIVLLIIWRIFFYDQAAVIDPLQNLLP